MFGKLISVPSYDQSPCCAFAIATSTRKTACHEVQQKSTTIREVDYVLGVVTEDLGSGMMVDANNGAHSAIS